MVLICLQMYFSFPEQFSDAELTFVQLKGSVSSFPDLGRMYSLVSRIQDGLGELKRLLETHIHSQGLSAIEKCGEAALNASISSKGTLIS